MEELEEIIRKLNKLGIQTGRIKFINIRYEPLFSDKAFPKIKIKLYKE